MRIAWLLGLLAACGGDGGGDDAVDGEPFAAGDTCGMVAEMSGGIVASIAPPGDPACLSQVSFGAGVDVEYVFLDGPVSRIALRADEVVIGAPSEGGAATVSILDRDELRWDAEGCVIDVVASDFYAEGELGDQYRTWGEVRCGAPAAPVEHAGDPVEIDELTFLVTMSWVP